MKLGDDHHVMTYSDPILDLLRSSMLVSLKISLGFHF